MAVTEFPEWVDGKAFAGWIEGRRPDLREVISESQSRALHRLRTENGRGSLDVVDQICCLLNLHINEIPEWMWTDPPGFGRKPSAYSDDLKERAERMLAGGTAIRDVSEAIGVPAATVKTWKRRMNGEG